MNCKHKALKLKIVFWLFLILAVFLLLRECRGVVSYVLPSLKKTDTIIITKPKLKDILEDTALVSRLRKIFRKTDTFIIKKYIPVKIKYKDTIRVPVIVTDTLVVISEDSVRYTNTGIYNTCNRDSTLCYGFQINSDFIITKDTIRFLKQTMKDFYFNTQMAIYEIERKTKYGFTETFVTVSHPKELNVTVSSYSVKNKIKRLGLGVFLGYGYSVLELKPVPVVGVGVTYNPFLIK